LNRYIARRLLLDKIEARKNGFVAAQRAEIEKIRRQKRKRSRRAKALMLDNKSKHSAKKTMRRATME
jgi:peptide chain release factor